MQKEEIKALIERNVLQAFREVISSNGLVDTGTLQNSATVDIDDDFNIVLRAEDYYKFLDEGTRYIDSYGLTNELIEHELFKRAEFLLEDYIVLMIEESLSLENE
jgi:hypothetical protein